MKLMVINGRLFGNLSNGDSFNVDLSDEQVQFIQNHPLEVTEEWIRTTFFPNLIAKEKEVEQMVSALSPLEQSGLFHTKNGSLYYAGIDLSVPRFLAKEFAATLDDKARFEALIKFWKLCSLNPNPQARQDLFKFLQGGRFTITSSGLFVGYRNVKVHQEGVDRKLEEFVTSAVVKVRGWKKNTKNYEVYQNTDDNDIHFGKYEMYDMKKRSTTPEGNYIGNLYELASKGSETVYTDNYTGKFRIKIGEPVTMPREDCDPSSNSACSYGLHIGNKSFLSSNSFGNVGLVCLVNPYNVVSVPVYDNNKLRCCEYLPIGIAEYDDEGKLIEIDTTLYEDDYCQFTVDQINKMLAEADMQEYQINTLFEATSSNEQIRNLANEAIKNRNVYVVEEDEDDDWDRYEEEDYYSDDDDEDDWD